MDGLLVSTMKKLYCFVLINIFISSLIAVRFFLVPDVAFSWLGSTFSVFAVLGHFFSLYILFFLICIPTLWLRKYLCYAILAILFSFIQITLYVDTIVFQQYRFHINESVLSMVLSGQVVDFSITTYLLMLALIIVSFCVEYLIIYIIDFQVSKPHNKSKVILLSTLLLIASLFISQFGHMVGFYYAYSPIMVVKEYIPLYRPLTSKKIMSIFDKEGARKVVYDKDNINATVDYPKNPLVINPENKKLKNIIFIVLDSWRYDTFSKEISPNTFQFVKNNNGVIFNNHYSTGNATRTGIFGLFMVFQVLTGIHFYVVAFRPYLLQLYRKKIIILVFLHQLK
ncbi:putative hydrolase of alkaline phosphatase superfamily [Gilliamella apicola SCGC AB-598-B02]|nr:putative hydrolase of alkaline phosphatase superfamily [Gilliamella apicola SCGC AB-598-B02]